MKPDLNENVKFALLNIAQKITEGEDVKETIEAYHQLHEALTEERFTVPQLLESLKHGQLSTVLHQRIHEIESSSEPCDKPPQSP